jgi:hypothetical protein
MKTVPIIVEHVVNLLSTIQGSYAVGANRVFGTHPSGALAVAALAD